MITRRPILSYEDWTHVSKKTTFIEFYWIGVDNLGQIGIFSSVTVGYIPSKVFSSYEKYIALDRILCALPGFTTAQIITKEPGSMEYWMDFGHKGLFAYDYQDIHRTIKFERYDLIAIHDEAILARSVGQLVELNEIIPTFNLTFSGDILFSQLRALEVGS